MHQNCDFVQPFVVTVTSLGHGLGSPPDEAIYDDGQALGDGNWQMFLLVCHDHPGLDRRYNTQ